MRLPKRIVYVPGMISLVILPILITVYVNKLYNARARQRVMEINWNATNRPEIAAISPFPDVYLPLSPKRSWSEVELTGNQITNQVKLATARAQIKDITNRQDTAIGVHFTLGKGATYGAFVSVLNMLLADNVPTYSIQDNGIWVINTHRQSTPPLPLFFCGTRDAMVTYPEKENIAATLPQHPPAILYCTGIIFITLVYLTIQHLSAGRFL